MDARNVRSPSDSSSIFHTGIDFVAIDIRCLEDFHPRNDHLLHCAAQCTAVFALSPIPSTLGCNTGSHHLELRGVFDQLRIIQQEDTLTTVLEFQPGEGYRGVPLYQ